MMVSILAAFNITKSIDNDGKVIEINDDFENDGLLLCVMISPFFHGACVLTTVGAKAIRKNSNAHSTPVHPS